MHYRHSSYSQSAQKQQRPFRYNYSNLVGTDKYENWRSNDNYRSFHRQTKSYSLSNYESQYKKPQQNHNPFPLTLQQKDPKRSYLTSKDINLNQINVKIDRILTRLGEEQQKNRSDLFKKCLSRHSVERFRTQPQSPKPIKAIDRWAERARSIGNWETMHTSFEDHYRYNDRKNRLQDYQRNDGFEEYRSQTGYQRQHSNYPCSKFLLDLRHERRTSQNLHEPLKRDQQRQQKVQNVLYQKHKTDNQRRQLNRDYISNKIQRIKSRHNDGAHGPPHQPYSSNKQERDSKQEVRRPNLQEKVSRIALSKELEQSRFLEQFKHFAGEKSDNKCTNNNRYKTEPDQINPSYLKTRIKTQPDNYIKIQSLPHTNARQTPKLHRQNLQERRSQIRLKNGRTLNEAMEQIQIKIDRFKLIKEEIIGKNNKQNISVSPHIRIQNQNYHQKPKTSIKSVLQQTGQFNQIMPFHHLSNQNPVKKIQSKVTNTTSSPLKQNSHYRNSKPDICQAETHKFLNILHRQVFLDHQFRKGKKWLKSLNLPDKWIRLQETFKSKGLSGLCIGQIEQVFRIKEEQNDPFYSFREDHETFDTITDKFLTSEEHWIRNMRRKFSYEELMKEQFLKKMENSMSDLESKGLNGCNLQDRILTINNFMRLLNFEMGQNYKTRDLVLIFDRFNNGRPVSFTKMMSQLTNYEN